MSDLRDELRLAASPTAIKAWDDARSDYTAALRYWDWPLAHELVRLCVATEEAFASAWIWQALGESGSRPRRASRIRSSMTASRSRVSGSSRISILPPQGRPARHAVSSSTPKASSLGAPEDRHRDRSPMAAFWPKAEARAAPSFPVYAVTG